MPEECVFTWKAYKTQWHQSRESILKDHCKVISKEVYNSHITVTFLLQKRKAGISPKVSRQFIKWWEFLMALKLVLTSNLNHLREN